MAEEALTVQQAVETIQRASAYEEPLRRRTEGVTWMMWGLVTGGLFASGSALEWVFNFSHPIFGVFWVPWLLAGIAGTKAAWTIAGVSLPPTRAGTRRTAVSIIWACALLTVAWLIPAAFVSENTMPPFMIIAVATPWIILGAINPHRSTVLGRKVMIAIGVGIAVGGVLAAPFLLSMGHPQIWHWASIFGLALGGGMPFVGGLWQALRG